MMQRGNALFLILIAVALFAALGYAVTQSSRGASSVNREQQIIDAARIIEQAGMIEQTVSRLILAVGCTDTRISFENNVVAGYTNASAPTNKSCHVFDPAGGGLNFPLAPASTGIALNYLINGNNWFKYIGTGDYPPTPPTSSTADLALYLPINSLSLCREINSKLNLPTTLAMDAIATGGFVGTYLNGNFVPDDGGNMAGFFGARSACLQAKPGNYPATSGAGYFFYHIILAR